MIIAKCPLRISLVGGSTDLTSFIDKYGKGKVISFSSNLYTYITLHKNNRDNYIIDYSRRETVKNINDIKNDIARECLKYFRTEYCTVTFNTDITSSSSGLASSSSYMIALIKCLSLYHNISMSRFDICELALKLERLFNPLTGAQDTFGAGIGGFKKISFSKNNDIRFKYLNFETFSNKSEIFIVDTGITRNSISILKKIDINKNYGLLKITDDFEQSIIQSNYYNSMQILNDGWFIKKTSSPEITKNTKVKQLDNFLSGVKLVNGHKLCGAGGGGHFLVFIQKEKGNEFKNQLLNKFPDTHILKIQLDDNGVMGYIL